VPAEIGWEAGHRALRSSSLRCRLSGFLAANLPRRVGRVPARGGPPGKALGEPSAVNRRSTRPTTEDAEGPGEWPRLPSACGATETLACAASRSSPGSGTGGGRDRASGPGSNLLASDRHPRGLSRILPDSRSAESGTIHASLNPRATTRTIGPIANSAGATPALALQGPTRDRRSTLGSRVP
jgi:hypothetical protein